MKQLLMSTQSKFEMIFNVLHNDLRYLISGGDIRFAGVDNCMVWVDASMAGVEDSTIGVDASLAGVDNSSNAVDFSLERVADLIGWGR